MNTKQRVSKWDNVKCLLIFLVVIGHFANQFSDDYTVMKVLSLFIYSFHMPLFIFLSGLLEKKLSKDSVFQWKKALYFVALGYSLKILIYLIKISFGKNPVFHALSDTGIPWYMFAMAAFLGMVYLLRNFDERLIFPMTVIFACIVGYIPVIGSFLNLSRIIVFFPFYYLGYMLNAKELLRFSEKKWVKEASLAIVVSSLVVCILGIDQLYSYIRLCTARNSYSEIHVAGCGFGHRFIWFFIAIALGWAILNLIPEQHISLLTYLGRNTLQVYFWHRLILYVMMYSGFVTSIQDYFSVAWMAVYLLIAVLITVVLSDKYFAYPLNWMRKVIFS